MSSAATGTIMMSSTATRLLLPAGFSPSPRSTIKLDPAHFIGGCEPGSMKVGLLARAAREEQLDGAGYTIYEVDWKYTPDQ